jgi:hypothetical protein
MTNRPLVLSFIVDKPDAVQAFFSAVVPNPESPANIFPLFFRG